MARPPIDRLASALGDGVCIAALAAAMLLPLGGRWLDPEASTSTLVEERNPAPFPDGVNLAAFPGDFEAWLGDNYGMRRHLIRWRNVALLRGLGVSPTDELVVGADDWLFITANRNLEAYRGAFRLSDSDLETWAAALAERRDWLAERGAHYLMVFAPDKPEIYGDRLPSGYERGAETPLDQLTAYLAEHSTVEHVDVRRALHAARADEDDWLYYPYGSHWTDHGAWIAYREILRALSRHFPALEIPREEDYAPEVLPEPGDTWGGRLRLGRDFEQARLGFVRQAPLRSRQSLDDFYERVYEIPDAAGAPELPRAVLFHDSFGAGLRDFLREDFSRLYTRNTVDFEPELVEAERPDVVIQLMAERRLGSYRPPVGALSGDAAARAAFAGAGAPLFALDAKSAARISPWRRARLEPGSDPEEAPLTVRLRGAGDGVLLPEVELPPGSVPILEVDIECPEAGELTVFYQTPASREYVSMRRATTPVAAGRNIVHLDVGVDDCTGRLLLMPGRARGEYVLHGLELRARPLDPAQPRQ
jgi:hypothetical protein